MIGDNKFELIVHTDRNKYDSRCTVDFVFGGEHHIMEISENEMAYLNDAFYRLWVNNRISEGLVPGGKCYGLFETEK